MSKTPGPVPNFRCPETIGGDIPGAIDPSPAFRIWKAADSQMPILVAVPHAGRVYPPPLLGAMRAPTATCLRLEDRHADALAQAAADQAGFALIVADAPRAMIDLNRAADDIDWSMVAGRGGGRANRSQANRRARSGLGLVPRRLSDLGEIWRQPIDPRDIAARIAQIHRPYHRALGQLLETLRDQWGAVLLIDLHSMPPLRPGPGHSTAADFVVGDRFGTSCDPYLSALAMRVLGKTGRAVAHNRPYAGGFVLEHHGAARRGIHAMQIEVCRSLYLDAALDQPSPRLPALGRQLAAAFTALGDAVADLGRQHYPQAAE